MYPNLKIRSLVFFFLIQSALFFTSCSGYRYTERNNPFAQYGIKSLSIPMFLNQSTLPNVSSIFTTEVTLLLTGFSGLAVSPGLSKNNDAVLFGVVQSAEKSTRTLKTSNVRLTKSVAPKALEGGNRTDFFVPSESRVGLQLYLVLIKNPTKEELNLLTSEWSEQMVLHPKVVFSEVINLESGFTREIYDGDNTDINYTQNKGALNRTVRTMAKSAVNQFKDRILYAF